MPLAALALVAGAAAAGGEVPPPAPSVDEARLEVVRERDAVRAELVLRLSRRPLSLELHAVEHATARLEELSGRLDGAPLLLEPVAAPRPARTWRAAAVGGPESGPAELVLQYRVRGAAEARGGRASLVVPLVLPRLRGGPARPDLFRARLPLPEGHTVWETFPSVPVEPAGDGAVELALPVLPGVVRVASGVGAAPLWAPHRLADGLTLGVLALLAAIGARALRRPGGLAV